MGLADFVVRLTLNTTGFTRGSDQALQSVQSIISGFNTLKTVIGGGLVGAGIAKVNDSLNEFAERADAIKDRAEALGASSNFLQRLANVTDLEKATSLMEKLADVQQRIVTGDDPGQKLAKSMAALGLTISDVKGKDLEGLIKSIESSFANSAVSAAKLAALKDLGIKNPSSMIEGFQKGTDSATANYGIIDEEQLQRLAKLKDINKQLSGGFFGDLKNSGADLFTKFMIGLKSLPGSVYDIFTEDIKGRSADNMQRYKNERGQEKIDASKDVKAKEQIAAAEAEKKAKEEAEKAAKQQVENAKKAHELAIKNRASYDELVLSQLSGEEKLQKLLHERQRLLKDMDKGGTDLEKQQKLEAYLANEKTIVSLGNSRKNERFTRQDVDVSARGGLINSGFSSQLNAMQKQLSVQQNMLSEIRSLNNSLTQDR